MSNNKSSSMKDSFDIASAWFGTHCGSGFATGAQGVAFFVMYGAPTPFMTILSAAIMAIFAYYLWEFARVFQTYDYRSFYDKLFHPYDKVFATIYEVLFLSLMTMGMGSVFAGGGQLISNIMGTPVYLGALIISVIVFLMTIFGAEFLRKTASILSAILILVLGAVTIIGMAARWDVISEIIATNRSNLGFGAALKAAVLYASFQCIITGTTVSISDVIKTKKDSMVTAVFGFILNGSMMVMICTMMLGYYPAVTGQVLPVYYIITDIGIPLLQPAYTLVLLLAFITTGITLIFAIVKRFEKYGDKLVPKIQTRRTIYSITFIVVCYIISLVGLLNIIKKGYSAIGYLGIPFVLIPTIIVGGIKVKNELVRRTNLKAASE